MELLETFTNLQYLAAAAAILITAFSLFGWVQIILHGFKEPE